MRSLFGADFQERVERQRRQVYHQGLLDSQRFGTGTGIDAPAAEQHASRGWGGGVSGVLGAVGGLLALIFFFYTIPAAVLSAVAAFPLALGILLVTREPFGYWSDGYGRAYRAAAIAVFCYLSVTAIVALSSPLLHEPGSSIFEISKQAANALTSIKNGRFSVAHWVGVSAVAGKSFPSSLAALAAYHDPGVLACSAALSRQIGGPFYGFRGFSTAAAVSTLVVPASLGGTLWVVAWLFRTV